MHITLGAVLAATEFKGLSALITERLGTKSSTSLMKLAS
jgi:hypothetical protein